MLVAVLLLSLKCVCCFVFFPLSICSFLLTILDYVTVYVLVSVEETLAETANKGSKSVCKILCVCHVRSYASAKYDTCCCSIQGGKSLASELRLAEII